MPLFILCTILKFYDRKRFQHLQVFGSRKYVANSCLNNIPTKIGKSSSKVTCRNYNFTFRCLLLTATPIFEQNMNASPKKQQASVSYTSTGTPSWRHDHHGRYTISDRVPVTDMTRNSIRGPVTFGIWRISLPRLTVDGIQKSGLLL